MKIIHDCTLRLAKGWHTIVRVDEEDKSTGLVIRHDAHTKHILVNDMDKIEEALNRERILERIEFANNDVAEKISDALLGWLAINHNINYRYLRWNDNVMVGFDKEEDVRQYDERNVSSTDQPTIRKKRIMLG